MKRLLVALCLCALVVGCDWGGIGNRENTTITSNQYVIYSEDGKPVQVLAKDGLTYINVGDASNELLIERGLIRLENGEVVKL
jgi:hypothetical protein